MAEYLEREALLKSLTQECKDCDNNFGYDCEECDYAHAMLYIRAEKAADVQPVRRGQWITKAEVYYKALARQRQKLGRYAIFCDWAEIRLF